MPQTPRFPLVPFAALAALATVLVAAIPALAAPTIGNCPVFPADSIWNTRVDALPMDPQSDAYVAAIGADAAAHADFAAGQDNGVSIGIPYTLVPMDQPAVAIDFAAFDGEAAAPDESDAGPYPIPGDAPIEGGPGSSDDRHVIVVQEGSCTLFELYKAVPNADGSWSAVGATRFDLETNELRIEGWTSADAAGLPIFPGLVRYDEVAAGEIAHALRFTAPRTADAYVWPARHSAGRDELGLPPMGQRFRLKAGVDISGFSPEAQVILTAMQRYGLILADNGSPWFVSGAPDARWDDDALHAAFAALHGDDFEAVGVSALMLDPDSGTARTP